jgi:PST family polysaccharide transporter
MVLVQNATSPSHPPRVQPNPNHRLFDRTERSIADHVDRQFKRSEALDATGRSRSFQVVTDEKKGPEQEGAPNRAAGWGSLRHLTIRGGAYLTAREGIGGVIRLAGVTVVVRLLGPGDYGIYSAAAIFVALAVMLAQGGTEIFLIRQKSEPTEEMYSVAFTYLLVTSLTVSLVAFALSFAAGSLVHSNEALDVFRVMVFSIPVNVIWAPAQACIERRFDYRKMGMIEITGDIVLYVVAVPLAVAHFGPWALVAGLYAWQTWLFVFSLILSGLRPRLRWSKPIARSLLGHGTSYAASNWVDGIGALTIPIVVGIYRGAAGIGYVSFALRLVDTIGFAQRGAWRLGVVSMSRVDDEVRLRRGLEEGSILQLLALGVPIAAICANARWVIPTVFGRSWIPAIDVFAVLSLVTFLRAPSLIQTTLLYSRGRNMPAVFASMMRQGLIAATVVVFVQHFGVTGYGYATACALLSVLYTQWVVRHEFVRFSYKRIWPFVIALGPLIVIPLAPMPWALALVAPAIVTFALPGPRDSLRHTYELVRLALLKGPSAVEPSAE